MKLVPFAAALAAIAIAQPAMASDTQAVSQESNKADKASERKVCRSVERIGSNIRDRICLTRKEWREVDEYLRTGE